MPTQDPTTSISNAAYSIIGLVEALIVFNAEFDLPADERSPANTGNARESILESIHMHAKLIAASTDELAAQAA